MKHPKRVGMSCKNTKFIKSGLTETEKAYVAITLKNNKQRWAALMAKPLNKYESHEAK